MSSGGMGNKQKSVSTYTSSTTIGDIGLTGSNIVSLMDILESNQVAKTGIMMQGVKDSTNAIANMYGMAVESSQEMVGNNLAVTREIAHRGIENPTQDMTEAMSKMMLYGVLGLGATIILTQGMKS